MKTFTKSELFEMYNDFLDELCETVKIGRLEYSPSEVLKSVDPVAYTIGYNEYLGSQVENGVLFYNEETDLYTDEETETD